MVNKAAKMSDRWWFFALLIIGMLYTGYERWESRQDRDRQDVKMVEIREQMQTYLRDDRRILIEALNFNTQAIQQNTKALERIERQP